MINLFYFMSMQWRWGKYAERIAGFQGTMTGGIGHSGSCPCLAAMTPLRCSMRSRSARRRTRMRISAAWHLTTRNRFSAWPFSFRNRLLPKRLRVFWATFWFTVSVFFLLKFHWYELLVALNLGLFGKIIITKLGYYKILFNKSLFCGH